MSTFGMNLRVTTDSKQGGRKYMEDCLSVKFQKSVDGQNIEYTYLGVFDGHGGVHAAQFAKENLLDEITKQKGFWSDDDTQILKAIKDGFLSAHQKMWKIVGTWPKTLSGHPSTAGTTVSVVFLRNGRMYVGHVGDSSVVVGHRKESMLSSLTAEMITVDHKPESPKELKRIEESGGAVVAKAGVQRVVWNRPRTNQPGVVRRSTPIDRIPFLAIARALGDLWSYNTERDVFVVSPEPDVNAYSIDLRHTRCIILASDGLWNMVRAQEAVDLVDHLDEESKDPVSGVKPATCLVRMALDRWADRCLRADNTSVICCILDPPDGLDLELHKQPSDGSLASTVRLSDGEECLSDADCSEEDISMDDAENDEEEDGNMSHLHMGSPAPFPKIMYPSPNVLKNIDIISGDISREDQGKDTKSSPSVRFPRVLTASADRWSSGKGSKPLVARNKLKTPRSAPPKVKRLNDKRNRSNTSPMRKVKGVGHKQKLTMSQMRKRMALAFEQKADDDDDVDTARTHNLRVRCSPPLSDDSKQHKNNDRSAPNTPNKLPQHSVCTDRDTLKVNCTRTKDQGDSLDSINAAATSSQNMTNSQSHTPSKEYTGNRSPKQGLSAKSPLRVHTSLTAGTSSMISPMWPSTLAADISLAPSGEEPLEAGVAVGEDVLSEKCTNQNSSTVRNFTALFSQQDGCQNKAPSSPTTRGCVRRQGSAAAKETTDASVCVKKVKALAVRGHSTKCPRTNRRLSSGRRS